MEVIDLFGNNQTAAGFIKSGYSKGWSLDSKNIPEKLYVDDDKEFELIHVPSGDHHSIRKSNCKEFGFTVDGFLELVREKKNCKTRFDYCLPKNYNNRLKYMSEVHSLKNMELDEVITTSIYSFNKYYGLRPHQTKSILNGDNEFLIGWTLP